MISPETLAAIRRLVEEDHLSHRKIAEQLGISRGTVARVATGEWRGPTVTRRPQIEKPPEVAWERCPECGAWVRPPCLRCWVMHLRKTGHLPPPVARPEGGLGLELLRKHRKRFRQVQVRRRKEKLRQTGPWEKSA